MENEVRIYGVAFIGGLVAFFSPILLMLYVIMASVLLDWITAIIQSMEAYKVDETKPYKLWQRRKAIRSRGLRKTALKLILYVLFIGLIYSTEIAIFNTSVYITNFTAFVIVFSELISIAENLDKLMNTHKFTFLIVRIRKLFEKRLMQEMQGTDIEEEVKGTNELEDEQLKFNKENLKTKNNET